MKTKNRWIINVDWDVDMSSGLSLLGIKLNRPRQLEVCLRQMGNNKPIRLSRVYPHDHQKAVWWCGPHRIMLNTLPCGQNFICEAYLRRKGLKFSPDRPVTLYVRPVSQKR